jgi:hypothetical protein
MEVALLCTHFERAKESDCLLQIVASFFYSCSCGKKVLLRYFWIEYLFFRNNKVHKFYFYPCSCGQMFWIWVFGCQEEASYFICIHVVVEEKYVF